METRRRMALCPSLVLLLLLLLLGMCSCRTSASGSTRQQKLEVKNHLKRLNKPAVKTIESPDGDIIDCVRIGHQPAFDHPFLKDHKIQMRPSYHPGGRMYDEEKMGEAESEVRSGRVKQSWHKNGECPEGTIPIRRTKREDLLRASSIKRFGKKHHRTAPQPPRSADPGLTDTGGHEHAIAFVDGEKYYGAKATINVWEPKVQDPNEFSLSQIWVLGGSFGGDLNSIEAGWQVSPDLYGDNNTRLFTYWTSDAYQATGCYNLLCSGFIQVNGEIAMGASISPVSAYRNPQYDISILVWKDPSQGHWWMQFGDGYVMGYWPSFLFTYLGESASMIEWGGEIVNTGIDGRHTSTQMGSGHFPGEWFGKSSYFRNIQVVDDSNELKSPGRLGTFTEKEGCYDVKTGMNAEWGHYFYYGGPGRNQKCP